MFLLKKNAANSALNDASSHLLLCAGCHAATHMRFDAKNHAFVVSKLPSLSPPSLPYAKKEPHGIPQPPV